MRDSATQSIWRVSLDGCGCCCAVPRQNSIQVQNASSLEVKDSFEGDFRLSKQMIGDGRESRMQRRKGHIRASGHTSLDIHLRFGGKMCEAAAQAARL
jgi:hypothetical protein